MWECPTCKKYCLFLVKLRKAIFIKNYLESKSTVLILKEVLAVSLIEVNFEGKGIEDHFQGIVDVILEGR